MRFVAILFLCLAITVQIRAERFFFDTVSEAVQPDSSIVYGALDAASSAANGVFQAGNGFARGAVDAVTGISKGLIGAGSGTISSLSNTASSFGKAIADGINEIQNRILKRVLQHVQSTLEKIQNTSRGALQAYEQASKTLKERIIELEEKQEEDIETWADKVKNKLANSTEDVQIQGQDLIDQFANQRSEDLRKCTDSVIGQLDVLQEKANSTAEQFHEPMNKLVQQVAKCSELKANDFRGLASCAGDIRSDLSPLAAAPGRLAAVRADIVRVGLTNLRKNVCVTLALRKFNREASSVEKQIDQLVADDKTKAEQETAPAEEARTSQAEDESAQ